MALGTYWYGDTGTNLGGHLGGSTHFAQIDLRTNKLAVGTAPTTLLSPQLPISIFLH